MFWASFTFYEFLVFTSFYNSVLVRKLKKKYQVSSNWIKNALTGQLSTSFICNLFIVH